MNKYLIWLSVLFQFTCQISKAETFKVGLPFLPRFNPITNQVNVANYIGMHLYYPLFEIRPNGDIKSHFLEMERSRAVDLTFTKYILCLKKTLSFSDGTKILVSDFYASFNLMSKMYPHLLPLESLKPMDLRCVSIEMKYPTPNLFKKLTGIASTIIKSTELKSEFPLGLGPYKISDIAADKISLKFTGDKAIRFNEIQFIKASAEDPKLISNFQDLNQIQKQTFDQIHLADFNLYEVSIPKMYSLVINFNNKNARLCARSILSKMDWITAYHLSVTPKKSFLPWEKPSLSKYDEGASKSCASGKIDLFIPSLYNGADIQMAISKAGLTNRISVKLVSNDEFGRKIFSGEEYIGLIGFNSTASISMLEGDYSTYFESFFSIKNRIISKPNNQIKELISMATKIDTRPKDREKMFENAESILIGEAYVLPIGSLKRQYRFTKNFSITEWFDYVNGIPDISAIY